MNLNVEDNNYMHHRMCCLLFTDKGFKVILGRNAGQAARSLRRLNRSSLKRKNCLGGKGFVNETSDGKLGERSDSSSEP